MAIRPFNQQLPQIGANTYIDAMASVIGDVHIGDDCSIWPFASIRGDVQSINIGHRSNIQDSCVLHVTHDSSYHPKGAPLIIGDDVTVGHHVVLHACTIHDRSLIGMGSIILDNAVIESDVMIGAGSLVPPGKVLTSGYLWLGSPVVAKRPLTEKERAFLIYSAQSYIHLKNRYLSDASTGAVLGKT